MTEAEVAQRGGASVERIRQLVELGILQPADGWFARRDVMRVRVVERLGAMGIEPDALARALASGDLTLGYLESAGRRQPRSDRTFEELAGEVGLTLASLQRIYVAFGLPRPEPGELVRDEDMEAIRVLPILLSAGVEEADLLRLARVWGDSARRVAQYLPHYFHVAIEERFRERGLRDNEAFEAAIRQVGLRIGRSGEDLLGWLFRRHAEVFMTEHQFGHVETALELAGVRMRAPRSMEAAVFADLTGFTRLTEESGDEVAAQISLALAQLVTEIAARHRGSVVKLLGDGVYLHFRDPADAVRAALEIVASTADAGLPAAHVAVNAGPMLYDEGDYFGRTVNIAARLAARATAGQVLVGPAFEGAVDADGFRLMEAGELELKGVAEPVKVFEAVAAPTAT